MDGGRGGIPQIRSQGLLDPESKIPHLPNGEIFPIPPSPQAKIMCIPLLAKKVGKPNTYYFQFLNGFLFVRNKQFIKYKKTKKDDNIHK